MWTWSTGLGIAAASGHESAPIQWAWVSGNPAGMSQRRSGGLESAAIRQALSQRRAGGHWVSGDPVWWSPANGAPGGAATRKLGNPPAGLGEPPPAVWYLPRSVGMRARGQRTRGTRGDPAKLLRRPAVGYGGRTSGDFLATGQTQTWTKQRLFKTKKQNGRRLRLGLVVCHGAHTREEQGHTDEDVNSNNSL